MMDRRGTNRRRPAASRSQRSLVTTVAKAALAFGIVAFGVVLAISSFVSKQNGSSRASSIRSSFSSSFRSFQTSIFGTSPTIAKKVFSAYSEQSTAAKQRQDLATSPLVVHIVLNAQEQVDFLSSYHCVDEAVERFQELPTHLAQELWKYCALYTFGGMYLDAESPLMIPVDKLLGRTRNVAVLADPALTKSMHGSLLYLAQPQSSVAKSMIEVLLTTSTKVLEASPLLLPRTLHDLIANQAHVTSLHAGSVSDSWFLLQHTCHVDPLRRTQVTAGISAYALNSYRYVAHEKLFIH
jgi:hypothetical protein